MIKAGDRIKFSGEGVVRDLYVNDTVADIILPNNTTMTVNLNGIKTETMAEQFKPGDIVRSKMANGIVFALGADGYLDMLNDGAWRKYNTTRGMNEFNSNEYEKVL